MTFVPFKEGGFCPIGFTFHLFHRQPEDALELGLPEESAEKQVFPQSCRWWVLAVDMIELIKLDSVD